jgi:hypothetical protein
MRAIPATLGRLVIASAGAVPAGSIPGTGIAVASETSDLGYSMMTDYLTAYRNWLLRK